MGTGGATKWGPHQAAFGSIARAALPSHILFEEQDGIYWLRGADLERAKKLLGLRVEGDAAGFDRLTWSVYVGDLAKQKMAVGIRHGNVVRSVHLQQTSSPQRMHSTPTSLAPSQLFGVAELEGWEHSLAHKNLGMRATLDRIAQELADGRSGVLAEWGDLYAYQVAEDIYEVDWQLTRMARSTVELLALAVHRAGHRFPCRLVPPRPQRGNHRIKHEHRLQMAEPVPYGQLALPL